jgi:prophage maintenance system killer protein
LVAALFLEVNGLAFKAPEEEVVERRLALAAAARSPKPTTRAGWKKST